MTWYQAEVKDVLEKLATTEKGLSVEEAQNRLSQYGANEITEGKRETPFQILLRQFKDFMIIILMIAAIISGFLGELIDTIAIIAIVILNAVIGFVQEYRAEKAMQALKKMAIATTRVLRSGRVQQVSSSELVPGDVVLLDAGDVVPADLRLIDAKQLKVEEASLTGESVPSEKNIAALPEENIPIGDRINLAFKGTHVTYGKAKGIVVETGMKTELGRIAEMLSEERLKTPLQKRLTHLGKRLALIVLVICVIVFLFGWFRGEEPILMLLTAISLAVAAIPEALPSLISIALAIGAKRMVKQNALVRKLPAVETLGSVTYICSDKTGTLTENKMTVEEVYAGEKTRGKNDLDPQSLTEREKVLFETVALNNDVNVTNEGKLTGDPTEIALYDIAYKNGFDAEQIEKEYPRVAEIPFDSDRKCMTTIHKAGDDYWSITKGAVDVLLEKLEDISEANKRQFLQVSDRMAADGLRVLGFAEKKLNVLPSELKPEEVEISLNFIGLVGMIDPPREEAKKAVAECKTAGIIPMMITGDHPLTAKNIAKRLGIIEGDEAEIATGAQLANADFNSYKEIVQKTRVYARVSPEQKLNIVKALQDNQQFVAMTGDGVNDAPSLKRADIGVAMGITGTDVSKEAADLILLDDNFATIVKAVKSGRRIYDNIRKFIKYIMTSNSGEIWSIFLAPFFGLPVPLLPVHILWINLVTDGLPGLALAAEPADKRIMQRPPRHPNESVFAHGLGVHVLWVGLLMGVVTMVAQAIFIDKENWQTIVFTVLCFSQMAHVIAIRSETESFFSQGFLSNKPLMGAVLLTFLLQLCVIYIPYFNPIFKTTPLSLEELAITIALSSIIFFAVEIEKWVKRRRYKII
jgi:P-type Ca2+ transporter type 2C